MPGTRTPIAINTMCTPNKAPRPPNSDQFRSWADHTFESMRKGDQEKLAATKVAKDQIKGELRQLLLRLQADVNSLRERYQDQCGAESSVLASMQNTKVLFRPHLSQGESPSTGPDVANTGVGDLYTSPTTRSSTIALLLADAQRAIDTTGVDTFKDSEISVLRGKHLAAAQQVTKLTGDIEELEKQYTVINVNLKEAEAEATKLKERVTKLDQEVADSRAAREADSKAHQTQIIGFQHQIIEVLRKLSTTQAEVISERIALSGSRHRSKRARIDEGESDYS